MSSTATAESIDTLSSARAMGPEIRERCDEIESARRLPPDLSERFARAGFFRMCVPEVYGGLEQPPATTMQTIEAIAESDASSAWCVMIGATSGTVLSMLPADSAREIFAHPQILLGGVYAPRGQAVAEGDGFRVNGRWQWGSGTQNADWVMGGCQVIRDGKPEVPRMMLVPADEIEFFDTWHVSGLCGTGSTDFGMNDLLVPASRAVGLGVDRPLERPLFAFPQFGLLAMGIAAVSLGLARASIEALIEIAGGKKPQGSSRSLAERPSTQSHVSRAEALVRSARAFYYEAIEAAWDRAQTGAPIGKTLRRDIRLATTHANRSSAKAVDLMYDLGGGTSVYLSSPLQRIFRDVHVATQHMMVGPATLEVTGRLLLGLETDTAQL